MPDLTFKCLDTPSTGFYLYACPWSCKCLARVRGLSLLPQVPGFHHTASLCKLLALLKCPFPPPLSPIHKHHHLPMPSSQAIHSFFLPVLYETAPRTSACLGLRHTTALWDDPFQSSHCRQTPSFSRYSPELRYLALCFQHQHSALKPESPTGSADSPFWGDQPAGSSGTEDFPKMWDFQC